AFETLDTQTTVFTDQAGHAHVRIRILPVAPNQTALLQVTDQGTGAYQRTSFLIAQSTRSSPGLFVAADPITFQGPNSAQCASSGSAAVSIFGGVPPYSISASNSAFNVSRSVVDASGASFAIRPTGPCATDTLVITDASGHTVTVSVSNILGT